jgi:hypothetical protein
MYPYIDNGRTASCVTMVELNVICELIDLLTRHYYNQTFFKQKVSSRSNRKGHIYKLIKINYTYRPRIVLSAKYTLKFFFVENLKMFNGKNLQVLKKNIYIMRIPTKIDKKFMSGHIYINKK